MAEEVVAREMVEVGTLNKGSLTICDEFRADCVQIPCPINFKAFKDFYSFFLKICYFFETMRFLSSKKS